MSSSSQDIRKNTAQQQPWHSNSYSSADEAHESVQILLQSWLSKLLFSLPQLQNLSQYKGGQPVRYTVLASNCHIPCSQNFRVSLPASLVSSSMPFLAGLFLRQGHARGVLNCGGGYRNACACVCVCVCVRLKRAIMHAYMSHGQYERHACMHHCFQTSNFKTNLCV